MYETNSAGGIWFMVFIFISFTLNKVSLTYPASFDRGRLQQKTEVW